MAVRLLYVMVLSRQTLRNKNNRGGRRQNINFREGCVIALATWLIPVARQTGSGSRPPGIPVWEFPGIRHVKNSRREFQGITEFSARISGSL